MSYVLTPPEWTEQITPEIAAHVLHHVGAEGGWTASGFKTHLLTTIGVADVYNRRLLALAYPGYVGAFELAQNSGTGTATLQTIAEGAS